jgi:hypothetical protein
MNTENIKSRLIDWISDIEDKVLLKKIDSIRKKNRTSWESLSYEDQRAIDDGLNQLNEGNWSSYSDVRKEIESILSSKK